MEVQGQVLVRKIILCGVSRLNFGGPQNVSEIGNTFQMWKPHLLYSVGHPKLATRRQASELFFRGSRS